MYDLYKNRKLWSILPGAIFLVPVIAFPYGAYKDFERNGFGINTILFIFFMILFLFIFIGIVMASRENPYVFVDTVRRINPDSVKDMEKDFDIAEDLGIHIWKGRKYYFIRGGYFMVIPIGKILSIGLNRKHVRRLGTVHEITIESEAGFSSVSVSNLVKSKEEIIDILRPLCYESGIEIKDLEK